MNEEQIDALNKLMSYAEEIAENAEDHKESFTKMLILLLRTSEDSEYDGPAWERLALSHTIEFFLDLIKTCSKHQNAYSSNCGKGMEVITAARSTDALLDAIKDLEAYRQVTKEEQLSPIIDKLRKNAKALETQVKHQLV